jgi:predicted nucleotidyltransferase
MLLCGVVHPTKALLPLRRRIRVAFVFGSAARGDMRPDSDLDVLVVMPEGTHRRHTAQDIYQNLFGIPISVDVVAATPDDLAQRGDRVGWSRGQPCVKVEKSMPCEDFEIDPDHG